MLWASTQFSR